MKQLQTWKAALAILSILAAAIARAQQPVLTADTQINSAAAANNYGGSTSIIVSSTDSALLQFNVADILPSGTTADQVLKARLIIFNDVVTTGGSVSLYQVTSSWSENSVTYATKPTYHTAAVATVSIGTAHVFHEFTITSLVQSWITTPSSNYGIELKASGSANISLDSKENTTTSHPAVLEIVLSGPVGPAGPTGPKGATGPSGSSNVMHDSNLTGNGSSSTPLALAPSISLTGRVNGQGGVEGENADTEFGIGVEGDDYSMDGGAGLAGYSFGNTGNGYGVIAEGITGIFASGDPLAGDFDGSVNVSGNLSKASGSFKIDHPLDPENKYLYHSFVESPDMMDIYNGNVVTDSSGTAVVVMPDWFESLNRDFRYQVTVLGQPAQAYVASEIADRRFTIKTDKPNVKVSWMVTGIRQDAWANAHRIPVEQDKTAKEKGHYMHPELFGHAGDLSVGEVDHPITRARLLKRSAPDAAN